MLSRMYTPLKQTSVTTRCPVLIPNISVSMILETSCIIVSTHVTVSLQKEIVACLNQSQLIPCISFLNSVVNNQSEYSFLIQSSILVTNIGKKSPFARRRLPRQLRYEKLTMFTLRPYGHNPFFNRLNSVTISDYGTSHTVGGCKNSVVQHVRCVGHRRGANVRCSARRVL